MEDLILISNLNDFIFCPASIYFHGLYGNADKLTYQSAYQINGTKAHENVDAGKYSTRKNIITALDVYSQEYGVVGKIDIYDKDKKMLIERKKHVSVVYDGYVFQLYAQCFSLREMGYDVKKLRIHSIDDNKNYEIACPEDDSNMMKKFCSLVNKMRIFDLEKFQQTNVEKCKKCIYEEACDRSLIE